MGWWNNQVNRVAAARGGKPDEYGSQERKSILRRKWSIVQNASVKQPREENWKGSLEITGELTKRCRSSGLRSEREIRHLDR